MADRHPSTQPHDMTWQQEVTDLLQRAAWLEDISRQQLADAMALRRKSVALKHEAQAARDEAADLLTEQRQLMQQAKDLAAEVMDKQLDRYDWTTEEREAMD